MYNADRLVDVSLPSLHLYPVNSDSAVCAVELVLLLSTVNVLLILVTNWLLYCKSNCIKEGVDELISTAFILTVIVSPTVGLLIL